MSKTEFAKRLIVFTIGLFFSGLGIAFSKHADLGISTVSSVPNVLSIRFDFLSFGIWSTITNCAFVLGQILILRKNFKPFQLMQIPMSFLFGFFIDTGMFIVSFIPAPNYFIRLVLTFIGIIVLAFGIALAVIADVLYNSGEGFVKAVSDVGNFDFGRVKVVFDICCVGTAAVLSLILLDFKIVGIREGTLLAALTTGYIVNFFTKHLKEPFTKILKSGSG